jgi:hypothetical protein
VNEKNLIEAIEMKKKIIERDQDLDDDIEVTNPGAGDEKVYINKP